MSDAADSGTGRCQTGDKVFEKWDRTDSSGCALGVCKARVRNGRSERGQGSHRDLPGRGVPNGHGGSNMLPDSQQPLQRPPCLKLWSGHRRLGQLSFVQVRRPSTAPQLTHLDGMRFPLCVRCRIGRVMSGQCCSLRREINDARLSDMPPMMFFSDLNFENWTSHRLAAKFLENWVIGNLPSPTVRPSGELTGKPDFARSLRIQGGRAYSLE
jgi:hypothetical protein